MFDVACAPRFHDCLTGLARLSTRADRIPFCPIFFGLFGPAYQSRYELCWHVLHFLVALLNLSLPPPDAEICAKPSRHRGDRPHMMNRILIEWDFEKPRPWFVKFRNRN